MPHRSMQNTIYIDTKRLCDRWLGARVDVFPRLERAQPWDAVRSTLRGRAPRSKLQYPNLPIAQEPETGRKGIDYGS